MLNITLDINGKVIEYFGVQRMSPKAPKFRQICHYNIYDDEGVLIGRVECPYGDARLLTKKVMEFALDKEIRGA